MSTPQHSAHRSAYGYGDQPWPHPGGSSGQPPGRPPRRGSGVALPLLLVVGVLAASLGAGFAYTRWQDRDRPERADTIAEPAGTGEAADAPARVLDGAGDTLTKKEAKAALLTVKDLPAGWSVDRDSSSEDDSKDRTEPARCAQMGGDLEDSAKPVAEAEIAFRQGLTAVQETIASYDHDIDSVLKKAGEAMSQCTKFTTISKDGQRTKNVMSALSFPNLGDRTLAFRATVSSEGIGAVFDVVLIAVGHNLVFIGAGGLGPVPGDDLEAIAERAVAKLG